ncbi:MAG: hypothetical protein ACC650_09810, partial [Gammaproteobacteria bacterium]
RSFGFAQEDSVIGCYFYLLSFAPQGHLSLRSGTFICGQYSFILSQGRFFSVTPIFSMSIMR